MQQLGFLDCQTRLQRIDTAGDPLARPDGAINRERFRLILEQARKKTRKSPAGAKGCDLILLVKVPILQSLCTPSDQALEFQIPDRSSFFRFLGLHAASKVPDAITIWRFREALSRGQVMQEPFKTFDQQLESRGSRASKGQIADAGIVPVVPKALGSRRENERIRAGEEPEGWSEARRRQKDVDARWIGKNGKSCFGYTNHIGVDVPHELTGKYQVSSAEVHESQVFEDLSSANTGRDLRADSACRSANGCCGWTGTATGNMCSARGGVIIPCRPGSGRASVHVPVSAAGWSISLAYRPSEPAVCSCVALAR